MHGGWNRLLVAMLASTMLSAGLASAGHAQYGRDARIAFDHGGGNEWWVEVRLVGPGAEDVSLVQARDDDGAWRDLTLRDWGEWAESFHVAPDNRVRFRAFVHDDVVYSCQFTHPEGVEQCNEFEPTPDARFDHVGGNASWVEVEAHVWHDGQPSEVAARVEGTDEWRTLRQQASGVWAGPLENPDARRVQFEARVAGGMSWALIERSCWFTHPEGDERCAGGSPPTMEAEFGGVSGNEWWVEASVLASKPLAGVDARVDGGLWQPLEKKWWGDWAASFHVPPGSRVELLARATDGSTRVSDGAWIWPDAAPYPAAGGTFDVAFHNVKGNEWWVQVNPDANEPVVNVMARITQADRSWDRLEPLPLKEYGDYAKSIHVPPGEQVRFEVSGLHGGDAVSEWFAWPPEGELRVAARQG